MPARTEPTGLYVLVVLGGHPPRRDLGTGSDSQPDADSFDVTLGRPFADHQPFADLAVRQAIRHQCRDLPLPAGQLHRGSAAKAGQSEERPDGREQRVDIADVRQVRASGQDGELGSRDRGGDQPRLLDGRGPVVLAVHDQGGGVHARQRVGDVDAIAELEQRGGGRRGRCLTLIVGERSPRARRRIGGEDLGDHVGTEAPVAGDEPDDVLAHRCRCDVGSAHPAAVQHQPVDGLGMPGHPLDRYGDAERAADHVETRDAGSSNDRLDRVELVVERPVRRPTVVRTARTPAGRTGSGCVLGRGPRTGAAPAAAPS